MSLFEGSRDDMLSELSVHDVKRNKDKPISIEKMISLWFVIRSPFRENDAWITIF